MSSEPPPPPPPPPPHLHPQPHNVDYLKIIRSPPSIYRWLDDIGESGGQPVSPSDNVPSGPLSGDQHVMDNGVDLKSPSSGTHAPASHNEMDSAEPSKESVQGEAALNRSHQHVLGMAQRFPSTGSQRLPLNQQSHADYSFENPPVPNSTDNANQGIHDRNNQQSNSMRPPLQRIAPKGVSLNQQFHANNGFENPPILHPRDNTNQGIHDRNNQQPNPMELPLQGFIPQGLSLNQQFYANQPGNGFEYPATPYLAHNANQGMQDGNNRMEYPSYPVALQYGKKYPGNMMTMNNHPFAPRYHSTQPLGQIAHQMGMTTGTINTMNYPSGASGQVLGNSLFYPVNGPNQFPPVTGSNQFHPVYDPSQFSPVYDPNQFPFNGPNPFPPVTGSNLFNPVNGPSQFLSVNDRNQFPLVTGSNQFNPVNNSNHVPPVHSSNQVAPLVPRQQNDVSHNNHGLPNPTPVSVGRAIDYPSESGSSSGASHELTSNEFETLDDIRNKTATPHDHTSDQRAPGPVGTESDVPDVPGNMPSTQHTVSNNQGGISSSFGDRMDIQQDWTLFDADHPSNANYPGPLFPQDARPRRPLPFGRVPIYASNVEATAAALVPGQADTRSAWDFPPNIPGTLTSSIRRPQMETPQASNPSRMPARIQRSDTRMEPPQLTNRVNKSIRRRKPATTQRLQSQIANNASYVLEQLESQTVEAQKDSDVDAELEEE